MPRQPRLDLPGQFYHVIARGVNRRRIFYDDHDRTDFLGRLADKLTWSGSRCFAWALMPNHFHLLIQSGVQSLGRMMQRILTGYAVNFNLRHARVGHLFQNRFKSILCQQDAYFKELVRYIHLNPLRAGLVQTLDGLDTYPWTGHAVLMGRQTASWQESDQTLAWWGATVSQSKHNYRQFMAAGLVETEPTHLEQGQSLRSVLDARERPSASDSWDIRVLGQDDFIAGVLAQIEERESRNLKRQRTGLSLEMLSQELCRKLQLPPEEARSRSKRLNVSRYRAIAAYRAVDELGWRAVEVSRFLGISEPSLCAARRRGRAFWVELED